MKKSKVCISVQVGDKARDVILTGSACKGKRRSDLRYVNWKTGLRDIKNSFDGEKNEVF